MYSLPVQANRPDSYAMLTTPYIDTYGKCLEIFYFPSGDGAMGFLRLDLIQENLEVKSIAKTENDDGDDSLETHRSFVSNSAISKSRR